MSKHPAYRSWTGMIQRCHNPKDQAFEYYGARGIAVCERWRGSFEFFWEDMGQTWARGLTVDRVDNERGYEPGNCCWKTKGDQGRNRRCCLFIDTIWGRLSIPAAAARIGITPAALRSRHRLGLTGAALCAPRDPRKLGTLGRKFPKSPPRLPRAVP